MEEKVWTDLRDCGKREEINTIFERNNITDYAKKSQYLRHAMNQSALYYTDGNESLSAEELYLNDETIFIAGMWRKFLSTKQTRN